MTRQTTAWISLGTAAALLAVAGPAAAPPPEPAGAQPAAVDEAAQEPRWVTAVEPKPLSDNVRRGLEWLVEHQHENGGWSQGEESPQMRRSGTSTPAAPNVGDTGAAVLALLRSGSTPSAGPYADAILKGLHFILGQIEHSDYESLAVSSVRGTRLQAKLGPNIDTFLASLVLSEATGHMPDQESENRLAAALDKVLYKIQYNQAGDGMWRGRGWAPALANAVAVKGLNRARQAGLPVKEEVLAKAEQNARGEVAAGRGLAGPGSAGVALYAAARNVGILGDSVNSNRQREPQVRERARSGKSEEVRRQAEQELARFRKAEAAFGAAQRMIVERLDDERFIAGFGSNGGEEFLSYVNIGESLVVKGGEAWEQWDAKMTANLNRVQNQDGSWTGHHCITGRNFCTATALMVLMVDRTPVPAEAVKAAKSQDDPARQGER